MSSSWQAELALEILVRDAGPVVQETFKQAQAEFVRELALVVALRYELQEHAQDFVVATVSLERLEGVPGPLVYLDCGRSSHSIPLVSHGYKPCGHGRTPARGMVEFSRPPKACRLERFVRRP